jgi:hypothetical protein
MFAVNAAKPVRWSLSLMMIKPVDDVRVVHRSAPHP